MEFERPPTTAEAIAELFSIRPTPALGAAFAFIPFVCSDMNDLELRALRVHVHVGYKRAAFQSRAESLVSKAPAPKLLVRVSGRIRTVTTNPVYQSLAANIVAWGRHGPWVTSESDTRLAVMLEFFEDTPSGWTMAEPPYVPHWQGYSFLPVFLRLPLLAPIVRIRLIADGAHSAGKVGEKRTTISGSVRVVLGSRSPDIAYTFAVNIDPVQLKALDSDRFPAPCEDVLRYTTEPLRIRFMNRLLKSPSPA